MLILSRHSGQSIVLPFSGITVTVIALSSNRVKLGVTAPPEITVFRDEVWDRIRSQRATARPASAALESTFLDGNEAEESQLRVSQASRRRKKNTR
jgi:carbon storage regulator